MTVGIYLLKVNDRSTRTKFGFVGFIANFEHISHLCSSVSIANFEHVIASWDDSPLLYGCLYSSLFMVIMVGQFTIYYCTGHDMKAMVFYSTIKEILCQNNRLYYNLTNFTTITLIAVLLWF